MKLLLPNLYSNAAHVDRILLLEGLHLDFWKIMMQPGISTSHTMLRNDARVVRFLKDHDATWNLNKSHNVEKWC
jgi:hypothetical protein